MPLSNQEIENSRLPSGIADTYSNLPLAPGDGEHWFVRDEGVMYYWDDTGGSWVLAAGGGGGGAGSEILAKIDEAVKATATVIVTGTNAADLQTAITNAVDGDVLEIRTNAVYSQITLPASKALTIRNGVGYGPQLTGTNCILIENGAKDHIVIGLGFTSYTTGDANSMGAGITFKDQGSKCSDLIFYNLSFEEVTAGSAVMLSYHRTVGGDNYANPPQPSEMSDGVAFVSCRGYKACKDGNEGAAIALRAVKRPFVYDCEFDGGYTQPSPGTGPRGIQFQNCTDILCEKNRVQGADGTNSEGIKVDSIGTPVAVRNTGWIVDNDIYSVTEGIDCDDDCDLIVYNNRCLKCKDEGISIDGGSAFARVLAVGNACTGCATGILAEAGSICMLANNACWSNTADYSILNGYSLPGSNVTTARSAKIPMWKGIDDISPSGTVTAETSFGQASNAGAASSYSRGDHTHGTPAAPSVPSASGTVASETSYGLSPNAGAAATFSKGDHTHGTPSLPSLTDLTSTNFTITAEGGMAIKLANASGAQINKGEIVEIDNGGDDRVKTAPANSSFPIGVAYADIPSGSSGWIVVSGIADVLVDAGGATRDYVLIVSAGTAGQATASATVPSATDHWREVGHALRTVVGSGLCRAVIHFN